MCSEGILYNEGEGGSRKQKCVLKAHFTVKEKATQGNRNKKNATLKWNPHLTFWHRSFTFQF